ncbi:hypothetical protein GC163_11105 [bacterium]|nr:hypothetical protein [bacterium]
MTTEIPIEQRLVQLESTLAHLQYDYDQLHGVVLALQSDVRLLQQGITKLKGRVEQLQMEPETRSPEDERPPHY